LISLALSPPRMRTATEAVRRLRALDKCDRRPTEAHNQIGRAVDIKRMQILGEWSF